MTDETTDKPAGSEENAPESAAAAAPESSPAAGGASPATGNPSAGAGVTLPPESHQSSGSVTRAIARQMLSQEKDTRAFGRRGAVMAGTLIVLAALLPAAVVGFNPEVAKQVRSMPEFGNVDALSFGHGKGPITLTLLLIAGLSAFMLGLRAEGVRRAKGLFWAGMVAFIALVAGRPAGQGAGPSTVVMIFGLLAWSGMLIAARVRLTFERARTAQVMGAISAGLFLFVFLVTDTGIGMTESVAEMAIPWGTVLVGLMLLPVVLSLINSENTRLAPTIALLTWFLGLGLGLGCAVITTALAGFAAALVTFQYIGVFILIIVGSIDWIGQLLFRHRADAEAARQLHKAVMAKAQS